MPSTFLHKGHLCLLKKNRSWVKQITTPFSRLSTWNLSIFLHFFMSAELRCGRMTKLSLYRHTKKRGVPYYAYLWIEVLGKPVQSNKHAETHTMYIALHTLMKPHIHPWASTTYLFLNCTIEISEVSTRQKQALVNAKSICLPFRKSGTFAPCAGLHGKDNKKD